MLTDEQKRKALIAYDKGIGFGRIATYFKIRPTLVFRFLIETRGTRTREAQQALYKKNFSQSYRDQISEEMFK